MLAAAAIEALNIMEEDPGNNIYINKNIHAFIFSSHLVYNFLLDGNMLLDVRLYIYTHLNYGFWLNVSFFNWVF